MTAPDLVASVTSATFDYRSAADVAGIIGASLFPEDVSLHRRPSMDDFLEDFQRRAVERGLQMMQDRGGFMLCDSVGLGKSFVALELCRIFSTDTQDGVIVVCPASLRSQWSKLIAKYVRPVESAFRHGSDPPLADSARGLPLLLTHAQLSRGRYAESLVGRPGLLVVDEAHAFRTPGTRRYLALRRLASSRRVCLLTATPVNNSLLDLYHLIRIWAADDAFCDIGISHLKTFFAEIAREPTASIAFRRMLREVMVRRTREEIRSELRQTNSRLRFPHLAAPVAIGPSSHERAHSVSHASVLRSIADLDLSAMGPSVDLLRFLLLKRLDSSPAALQATLQRLLRYHREFISACDEGFRLSPAELRAFGSDGFDTQMILRHVALNAHAPSTDTTALRHAAMHDIALFENMMTHVQRMVGSDDKLVRLRHLVTGDLAGRQVLVFSEFRETAVYLWRHLVNLGSVALVHGGGARLGLNQAGRLAVIERFDRTGRSASRASIHLRERVRILIATDVLSEGLNLHGCGTFLRWGPADSS